ncbi:response regulator transcription factor [Thermodesulfobacteriota bacterium]
MLEQEMLKGKKILIVDDEPDVLETLEDLLYFCDIEKAANFEDAKKLLETQDFDMTILDIMGVDGYRLLQIAIEKKVIPVMLTAKALSPEDVTKSFKEGAASYIPKQEMARIATFLSDILMAKEKGESPWWRWSERLGPFFKKLFGPSWNIEYLEKTKEEIWKEYPYM